ncbi:MAG: response regulator [Desulfobacteraceae bacterium]|nr:response regulator [Desulfobacteraceae bacterium]
MKRKPLVLAVDDRPQNLQFLGKLLSDNGYDVALAQNGMQALNFVQNNEPHIILLDIIMPKMDGYEVCERLKADASTAHIPVIFLTAKIETDDVVKGFNVGGIDYVTKPFNSAELLARVKTQVEIKILRGLLPMCSKCKKIRNDKGFWKEVDSYLEEFSMLTFSHGLCPDCLDTLYGEKPWFKKAQKQKRSR